MSSESPSELKFDIGHVLFIDIVGYSKLLIAEQSDQFQTLREIVRGTEQFKKADAEGKLLRLPTGDGGALVFRNTLEAPVLCALEISKALKSHPELKVRMGIHSGPVNEITDLNEQANIAGVGINLAQRVMDCGDAGHILLSKRVADDLEQYPQWRSHLSDLGECEVKHGARVSVVNLYTDDAGNRVAPQKFSKQPATAPRSASVSGRDSKFALITGAALVLLLIIGVGWWFTRNLVGTDRRAIRSNETEGGRRSAASLPVPEKSIAVLPFDNLSDDKSNAYFAEGIQDEILTRLSKIAALKVISRTSTQKYKSAPDNLREVGQQLGVANLLEGSVQKAGNAVHVNVQLIKAATDAHLWAESYDRELQNIFAVEGEVAGAIADQLNAKLTGSEKESLSARPTSNPQAYDAYLRGLAFAGRVDGFQANITKSIAALEEAVRLDPQFGLAWARVVLEDGLAYNNFDRTPQRQEAARQAAQNALKLVPTLPEAQLADGIYKAWFEHDYSTARSRYETVRQHFPNNSLAVELLASMSRREGQWDKSHDFYREAVDLDPQNVFLLADASLTDVGRRDVVSARKLLERARNLSPQNSTVVGILAATYQMSGDFAQAQTLLDGITPTEGEQWYFNTMTNNAIFLRKYERAIAMLKAQLSKPEVLGSSFGGFQGNLADLQRHAGDTAAADHSYEQARVALETALRGQPENSDLMAYLGWVEAWLGHKDKALDLAHKAVALTPASNNGYAGPEREETLARIEAHFGDKDNAIAAVQRLLSIPYGAPPITAALVRVDPDWDNLRGDPRFERLCQEPTK